LLLNRFFSGSQFGTVIALVLSGTIAESLGWEWVFYFFGILGTVWCFAWLFICHDSPAKHPRISQVISNFEIFLSLTSQVI
jgi:MFS family permease